MTQLADPPASTATAQTAPPHFRMAIVGAGFSGLGLGIKLLEEGIDEFVILERRDEVGGTWRDNSYPGCACDVPSHLYSFSFAPNPDWSHTYSRQPEIQDYLRRTARESGVLAYVRFGHRVQGARWDEDGQHWNVVTSRGELTASFLVSAMGPLSAPAWPDIPGLESFEGKVFHSARWDHDHDLADERVGVIGTGASAIQFVPEIQPEVGRMHVFQRTPAWILPRPGRSTTRLECRIYRRLPLLQKLVRSAVYWRQELLLVPGLVWRPQLTKALEALARRHLRKHVPDASMRERLTPHFRLGCKRILISNEWYQALAEPNVELVTDGIREVKAHSVVTADGKEREVDTLILATGFRVTDAAGARRIHGRGGVSLGERWQESPQAYLGTTVAGFPNLFLLVGPNLGPGHTSVVFYTESQVRYILDCLDEMERCGATSVEVREDVQHAYNRELQERMRRSVWTTGGCNSWYLDRTGRNTTLWPGFSWELRWRTRRFDVESYRMQTGAPTEARTPVAA